MFHNYIGTQYKITKQVQIITTLFNYGHAVKTASAIVAKNSSSTESHSANFPRITCLNIHKILLSNACIIKEKSSSQLLESELLNLTD